MSTISSDQNITSISRHFEDIKENAEETLLCLLVPVIGLVALPIFAGKIIYYGIKYLYLSGRTITNQTKFGRIQGQDYTKWNGKQIQNLNNNQTKNELIQNQVGNYLSGKDGMSFIEALTEKNLPIETAFTNKKDLQWLDKEFERRKVKDLLDASLTTLQISCKALIPIIGIFWILKTMKLNVNLDCKHKYWHWTSAIDFHRKNLLKKLNIPFQLERDIKFGIKLGDYYYRKTPLIINRDNIFYAIRDFVMAKLVMKVLSDEYDVISVRGAQERTSLE